jgi:hypothetical protein
MWGVDGCGILAVYVTGAITSLSVTGRGNTSFLHHSISTVTELIIIGIARQFFIVCFLIFYVA